MPLDSAYQILNLSVYCKGHMHAINVIDMGKSTFCHSYFMLAQACLPNLIFTKCYKNGCFHKLTRLVENNIAFCS